MNFALISVGVKSNESVNFSFEINLVKPKICTKIANNHTKDRYEIVRFKYLLHF